MKKEDYGVFFNSQDGKVISSLFFLVGIIIPLLCFNILPRNTLSNNIYFRQGIVLKRIKTSHYTAEGGVINQ